MFKKLRSKNLLTTFLATAIIAVLGLGSGILLAHNLTTTQRGEYAAIIVWISALGIIGEFGLGFALSYYAGKKYNLLNYLWSIGIMASLFFGIILILLGFVIFPSILKFHRLTLIGLYVTLFSLPFSLYTGFTSHLFLGLGNIEKYNIIRIITSFLNILFVLTTIVFLNGEIIYLCLFYLINQVVSFLIIHKLFINYYKPYFRWNNIVLKSVFSYGIKTYFSSFSAQINFKLDQLIMSSYSNVGQLSIYAIAVSYSSIITPIYSTFGTIMYPKLLAINDIKIRFSIIIKHVTSAILLSLPILLILFICSERIIEYVFSTKYISSSLSGRILLIAIVFEGINRILGNSLRSLGLPIKPAFSEFVGVVFSAILLYFLLPRYGAVGASIASLISYLAIMLCQIIFLYRFYVNHRILNIND